MPKRKIQKPAENSVPLSLISIVALLLIFGLIIIYNATAYYSQSAFNGPFRFVFLQAGWIFLGGIIFLIFSNFNYKSLDKVAFYIFIANLGFLAFLGLVGLFACRASSPSSGIGFAPCINGASRWFYLNPPPFPELPFLGVVGFQPGELAKLSIVLYLSTQLNKLMKKPVKDSDPFVVYLGTALLVSFLLFLQPNMSTAVLVFLIATSIFFVSGLPLKRFFMTLPFLLVGGFLIMLSSEYRRTRFLTLLGVNASENLTTGYHIKQILIALGSGGLFGVGFGQSRQKYQYLPEVSSDSIFAIVGEEFGFMGSAAIIIAFSLLIYHGIKIAKNSDDILGTMMATGITSWIGLQFFVNIAAMTKLIPLTGVPIPLISYGGSSMIFSLAGLGILQNINKQNS